MPIARRIAVALALLVGALTTTTTPAQAAVDALISIDVVVVGTPPPGAALTLVLTDGSTNQTFPVTLAGVGDGPEVVDVVVDGIGHGVYVDPATVGSIDEVDYGCVVAGVSGSIPDARTRCDELAGAGGAFPVLHAYSQFWGQEMDTVAERSDVTVTVIFDPPCDGREVTVNNNRGEVPTQGNDVILGTPADDRLDGRGGHDVMCGGGGGDTLVGGPGRDRILGGPGADRLSGGDAADALVGGSGADTLKGQTGADRLDGGPQRDTCDGGPQLDTATACETRTAIP